MTPLACLVAVALGWIAAFFFSGMETGLYTLNKDRLRVRATQGDLAARRLHALLADPEGLIATILAGNNLFLFLLSAIATVWMVHRGIGNPGLWNVLLVAPFLFWTAELLPKELFRRHAETLAYRLAGILTLARRLFAPLVWVMKGGSLVFTRVFKEFSKGVEEPLNRRRLGYLFLAGVQDGVMSPYGNRVIRNILEMGSRRVLDVMVPYGLAVGVPSNASVSEMLAKAGSERHSRLLVFGEAPGEVLGSIHLLDALLAQGREARAGSLARPLFRLPAQMKVPQALSAMRQEGHPMALAEEGGRVVGLVTIKDLVEEVVGELWDW